MAFVVNQINFKQEVLNTSGLVLVHFWTPWCGLCRLIDPILDTLQAQNQQSIKIASINADENFQLTNYYQLRNLPTIMLFHNGKLIKKLDNFNSRDRLKSALECLMNNSLTLS